MTDETTGQPGAPGADDATASHELANKGPFSADQLRELAQQEVNAGRLSLEDANASLQADGAEPLDGPPAEPEPSSSPTAAEAMEMALPPAEPQHFDLGPIDDSPDAAEHDANVRAWLATGLFDRGTGSYIGKEISRVAESQQDATEADREFYEGQQRTLMQHLYGDRAAQMLDDAQAMAEYIEIHRPGFVDHLVETGAANSIAVITQLAHQAQRIRARNGK